MQPAGFRLRTVLPRPGRHHPWSADPEQPQEFLVQPGVDDFSGSSATSSARKRVLVGLNRRGYRNLAAEGRFEEGYILSREPNPVAARTRRTSARRRANGRAVSR